MKVEKPKLLIMSVVLYSPFIVLSCSYNLDTTTKLKGSIIPIYAYPTSYEYSKIESIQTSKEIFVILNPNNGPGTSRDNEYYQKINSLKEKNFKILGYVYTSYGSRDISNIIADIDNWFNFYPSIDGIFFDEVISSKTNINFYSQIITYTKNKNPSYKVVLNPGVIPDKEFFDIADIVIIAEVSEDVFLNKWFLNNNANTQKSAILIYDSKDWQISLKKAISNNIPYIYITDEKTNTWYIVSSYVDDLLN